MNLRRIIRRWNCCLMAGVIVALSAASAPAGIFVVADFNDIASGTITSPAKGGGTGFTGNWSGSSTGNVVAGDLTSPLYNLSQASGTAQHFRSVYNGTRQDYRTVAPATIAGEVWFSFLARTDTTDSRAGLSINSPTASPYSDPGSVYTYVFGDDLYYSFGAGTAGIATDVGTVGSTNLIVGRMSIAGAAGLDSISLWLNPNLIANPNINSIAPIYSGASVNFLDSFIRIGALASGNGTTLGGHVDNIRISDGNGNASQAYFDVTGVTAVPEPSSALLVSFGAAAFYRFRRRRLPAVAQPDIA